MPKVDHSETRMNLYQFCEKSNRHQQAELRIEISGLYPYAADHPDPPPRDVPIELEDRLD